MIKTVNLLFDVLPEPASIEEHHVEEPAIPPPSEVVLENGNEVSNPTENGGSSVEVEIVMDQQSLPNGNAAPNVPEPTASVPRESAPMKSYASIVSYFLFHEKNFISGITDHCDIRICGPFL